MVDQICLYEATVKVRDGIADHGLATSALKRRFNFLILTAVICFQIRDNPPRAENGNNNTIKKLR